MIQIFFFSCFTLKAGIIKPIFNNEDKAIQIVNSKPKLSKIWVNTNNTTNKISVNLRFN